MNSIKYVLGGILAIALVVPAWSACSSKPKASTTSAAATVCYETEDDAGPGGDNSDSTFEVGPGLEFENIGDVALENLVPGDTVLIHWRPEPYREKMLLSRSGEEGNPIRIIGVPGPEGQLPVISGENATTRAESVFPYAGTADRGVIIMTPQDPWVWGDKTRWVTIQNLEIRSAYRGEDTNNPLGYTDGAGNFRGYSTNGASIFVERGEHIVVRNCTLTDSAYGFFVASGGDEATMSRDILLENSYVYGNGETSSDRRHNIYTEAGGMVFQGNRFGPQRPGARGNQLKDRSAGTIIRYNWIEGGAHLLDLVEPEEGIQLIDDPRYHDTYVYGNIMLSGPNDGGSLIHYGGDNGAVDTYRKGTLHFFHNTVVIARDSASQWFSTVFRVETDDETVDAFNNIFWVDGSTNMTLMQRSGHLNMGGNWLDSDHALWEYPDLVGEGTVTGVDTSVIGDFPGFTNANEQDFTLVSAAAARRCGSEIPNVDVAYLEGIQYSVHQGVANRKSVGACSDAGAFGD